MVNIGARQTFCQNLVLIQGYDQVHVKTKNRHAC